MSQSYVRRHACVVGFFLIHKMLGQWMFTEWTASFCSERSANGRVGCFIVVLSVQDGNAKDQQGKNWRHLYWLWRLTSCFWALLKLVWAVLLSSIYSYISKGLRFFQLSDWLRKLRADSNHGMLPWHHIRLKRSYLFVLCSSQIEWQMPFFFLIMLYFDHCLWTCWEQVPRPSFPVHSQGTFPVKVIMKLDLPALKDAA